MPLIIDGKIQNDTLTQINKNKSWLNNILSKKNISLNNIFYAFYKGNTIFIIKKSDVIK